MTEETLFQQALALPVDQRASFLDRACAEQPELRAAVAALLAAHEKPGNLLDQSPAELGPTMDSEPALPPAPLPMTATADYRRDTRPGVVIAERYTLQEKIGEGGMGEVWVARQTQPVKRKVALKLIKTGMDSRAVLQRFEQERQALAMMDHPNIARVLDGGMTRTGQPFFVMELVNGLPLTTFCDQAKLTPRERLELFVPICQAVQHAHQKGIVHRDLKPPNILVTLVDGRPIPKVIDFGVAKALSGKLTEESMSTGFGAAVGTLEYMSPEQAGFSAVDVDTRADIYSLGVILYELLTGLRPIDAKRLRQAAATEMVRMIQEEEPSKPSTRLSTDEALPSLAALRQIEPKRLMALLRGDLDWVVMKCLEKSRDRRYETANGLARDIQRYLDGDAVEACPPSLSYRSRKFLKRNKGPVIAASLLLLVLVSGVIGTTWGLVHAQRARQAESRQRLRAEERETQAIEAVKRFGEAVANESELKNSPQLEALRKRLLKEPLVFFKELRNRLQSDTGTRQESLLLLSSASDQLGYLTYEIGDRSDALIAFRESHAILQKLAEAHPGDNEIQKSLAVSYINIGNVLGETGKPAEALRSYQSALAIQQRLTDANPTVVDFQSNLASCYHSIGNAMATAGNSTEAVRALKSALAIRQRLVDTHPTVTGFQRSLVDLQHSLGIALSVDRKPAEALQAYRAALDLQQQLVDANPSHPQFQSVLAGIHSDFGTLLHTIGEPAEALQALESAREIQQRLVDANPTVTQFQHFLAVHHTAIGGLLKDTGKPDEALREFESALEIRQKLAHAYPTVASFQTALSDSLRNIGELQSDTGDLAEALKAYKTVLGIRQQLADSYPTVANYQSDLGAIHNEIGGLLIQLAKPAEARQAFYSALAIQRKVAESNPSVTQYQVFLAAHFGNLGRLLLASEKPADILEAIEALESARVINQKLMDANPTDTQNMVRYAKDLASLGRAFHFAAKPGEAMKAYETAMAIQQRVVDANPGVLPYQSELGAFQQFLGDHHLAIGNTGQAIQAYRTAVAIQQRVADANPTITQYQEFLARHHQSLAELLRSTGEQVEAVKSLETALAILQNLSSAGPHGPEFEGKLAYSYNNIAVLLRAAGRMAESEQVFESALALQRKIATATDMPDAASQVGNTLNDLAVFDMMARRFDAALVRLREAIVWQTKALATDPATPRYRRSMGNHLTNLNAVALAMGDSGIFAEAEREYLKFRDSDPAVPMLDARLAEILKGDPGPHDEAERLALAQRAYEKSMYKTSARLFAEALTKNPDLGQDVYRFNAACAAAMAGGGKGTDDAAADEAVKSALRQQALDWLQSDLANWTLRLATADDQQREFIVRILRHWRVDTGLAGVRDSEALETLSEAERERWTALWTQVDGLLAKAAD